MNKLKYFLPLIVFGGLGWFLLQGIELDPTELPSPLVGKAVPAFKLPSLGPNKIITENDLKGKVSLLNVWATWCVSCRMEHPYLVKLSEQGVSIIGLNYKDDNQAAKKWLDKLGNPYRFNISDKQGKLGLDLGVFGAPETFLIDKKGMIRHKRVGVIDERVWKGQLQPLYKQLQYEQLKTE